MKKILIGTHNPGKFKEISSLLSKKLYKLSPLSLNIKSPKEYGKTFRENSIIKANYFCRKSNLTSISDDSGLSINCLGGQPGIYSARWGKKYGGFNKAMKKIIQLIKRKRINKKKIIANFVCSLTIKFPKKKAITVTGKVYGRISDRILGKNGFGYDPIFIPRGKKVTFGQMKKKEKYKIDHRYVAFKKLKKKIKTL